MNMIDNKLNHQYLGRAGELRVMSELLLRGMNCATCEVDNYGIDIIVVPSGKRIQVKTSRSEYSNCTIKNKAYRYPAYLFGMSHRSYTNKWGKDVRPQFRKDEVDFAILWAIDNDWFFIIPSKDICLTQVNIPINLTKSKYAKYLNAWDLLKEES
jgi:hypothetical protein